jgi:hypothetical protein
MMATLHSDGPDVEAFVDAKRERHGLCHSNLSVLVTDEFMQAVRDDGSWPLVLPDADLGRGDVGGDTVERRWPGFDTAVPCRVVRRLPARGLWDRVMLKSLLHCSDNRGAKRSNVGSGCASWTEVMLGSSGAIPVKPRFPETRSRLKAAPTFQPKHPANRSNVGAAGRSSADGPDCRRVPCRCPRKSAGRRRWRTGANRFDSRTYW